MRAVRLLGTRVPAFVQTVCGDADADAQKQERRPKLNAGGELPEQAGADEGAGKKNREPSEHFAAALWTYHIDQRRDDQSNGSYRADQV
ncbi:MAG TPA: hypothetical protein VMU57_01345 [Edaphobacter sp.]|uniref:hypothetical protein n=1 Tax=Edaphobacter sp. TaxID=1934404 RepID=UPI002B5CCF57|nr:hypothetical protein [Edaphobacter sp.]HUZ93538.1 hypothetical protein [Edaphobacter sp.]